MSSEKNLENSDEHRKRTQKVQTPKNIFQQAWNGFIKEITDGLTNLQQTIEEGSKKNQETWDENKQKVDNFFTKLRDSWETDLNKFSTDLDKFQMENKEEWEKNKLKITEFFQKSQENWNTQLKKWHEEIQRKQRESAEEWEMRKQKINKDFREWRDQTKRDWESGVKQWRKEMIKGSYMFLVFMIPILVVLFIIVWLITWLLPDR